MEDPVKCTFDKSKYISTDKISGDRKIDQLCCINQKKIINLPGHCIGCIDLICSKTSCSFSNFSLALQYSQGIRPPRFSGLAANLETDFLMDFNTSGCMIFSTNKLLFISGLVLPKI